MLVLSGADLVLPERVLPAGTLVIADGRIADIRAALPATTSGSTVALHGHTIVPGFIDLHVHGVGGVDVQDAAPAVERVAAALPRFGVTAFAPTTVASTPAVLAGVLDEVRRLRRHPQPTGARVLPAHLESNFISADFAGAQPRACLRLWPRSPGHTPDDPGRANDFTADALVDVIERNADQIAIVTLAPELEGALERIAWLRTLGIRVSLGHSGATYAQASAAIAAGATQATHLFNRMLPLHHREPGLAGAVLDSTDVIVELICDGVHVHPVLARLVIAAKRPSHVMAVSDGTALAGLPPGSTAHLGGQTIVSRDGCARLDDGTLAGSVLTMDAAFRVLTATVGLSMVDAAAICATTPARALGLSGQGVLAVGAAADLVVLDGEQTVVQTYIAGRPVYSRAVAVNSGNGPAV